MNRKPIIIGIGELLWDMLPTGKKVGGAPVNFAYHAAKSGAESYAISAVGDDELGREILDKIAGIDIHTIIEKVHYPTGVVQVKLKDGIPDYTIIENVAWDFIPLTDRMVELAKKADAICFGTLAQRSEASRSTIQTLVSQTAENAYRVLDINLRQQYYNKELIEESIKCCNILKINDEELIIVKRLFSFPESDETESCLRLIKTFDLKMAILTAGADYSLIITPEKVSRIKTPKVAVADTVGAGDSFTGAFIAALLMGKSLEESHQIAVERAAHVCTQEGAWV